MIKKSLEEAINNQINAEIYSGYLYIAMSAYFQEINLEGFAGWMEMQAREEFFHASKFYHYLVERGGRPVMAAIDAPPGEWNSPLHVFEETLKHEELVTSKINDLMDLAIKENDHASQVMLQWFVSEQVEEEATAGGILQKLKLIGNNGNGLFMIDKELGSRTFSEPAEE